MIHVYESCLSLRLAEGRSGLSGRQLVSHAMLRTIQQLQWALDMTGHGQENIFLAFAAGHRPCIVITASAGQRVHQNVLEQTVTIGLAPRMYIVTYLSLILEGHACLYCRHKVCSGNASGAGMRHYQGIYIK